MPRPDIKRISAAAHGVLEIRDAIVFPQPAADGLYARLEVIKYRRFPAQRGIQRYVEITRAEVVSVFPARGTIEHEQRLNKPFDPIFYKPLVYISTYDVHNLIIPRLHHPRIRIVSLR